MDFAARGNTTIVLVLAIVAGFEGLWMETIVKVLRLCAPLKEP